MADLFMAKRMHLFAGDWRLIDTAPIDQDVTLLVTDGRGEPYRIPYPCKRTAGGGVGKFKQGNAADRHALAVEAVQSSQKMTPLTRVQSPHRQQPTSGQRISGRGRS